MNLGLSNIDISGFLVDEHSFFGQTIKLGIDYNQLPPNADEPWLPGLPDRVEAAHRNQRYESGRPDRANRVRLNYGARV